MPSETSVTLSDRGKEVVTQDNEVVGEIAEVQEVESGSNRVFVEPDSDLSQSAMSRLGWTDRHEEGYELDPDRIGAVYEDQVRLEH
ncbi:hypothetical protein C475_12105 [Halosimplex carlsbadense 2-9-1]|uniref:PRC-barrel domain-containing protein n=1 Tax=Halosimplex carlsbadense 2-9-1 TaxID=797114 RepID=M0CNZ2_9EURY|nr:hypothetical protein [Halosimplex carlsbadense]ELZ24980.1 hypothetical protein C475_12105 [Halosimplex carlsbadense 2-9-1]